MRTCEASSFEKSKLSKLDGKGRLKIINQPGFFQLVVVGFLIIVFDFDTVRSVRETQHLSNEEMRLEKSYWK